MKHWHEGPTRLNIDTGQFDLPTLPAGDHPGQFGIRYLDNMGQQGMVYDLDEIDAIWMADRLERDTGYPARILQWDGTQWINDMVQEWATRRLHRTIPAPAVTRIEVIGTGREYTTHDAHDVSLSLQDHGRTLKVFLRHTGGDDQ